MQSPRPNPGTESAFSRSPGDALCTEALGGRQSSGLHSSHTLRCHKVTWEAFKISGLQGTFPG